jgi:hypothetical protein
VCALFELQFSCGSTFNHFHVLLIVIFFSINNGELKLEDTVLTKSILENTKCFLLDCGAELFVWVGRVTQVEDRKNASAAVEVNLQSNFLNMLPCSNMYHILTFLLQKFVLKQNRPKTTRIAQVIQGYENYAFKSKFESWPVSNVVGNASVDEGRGKVAGSIYMFFCWHLKIDLIEFSVTYSFYIALLKKKGDVKGAPKSSAPVQDVPPLLESGGKLEVFLNTILMINIFLSCTVHIESNAKMEIKQ